MLFVPYKSLLQDGLEVATQLPVHVAASTDAPLDLLYELMQLQHGQLRGRGSGSGGTRSQQGHQQQLVSRPSAAFVRAGEDIGQS